MTLRLRCTDVSVPGVRHVDHPRLVAVRLEFRARADQRSAPDLSAQPGGENRQLRIAFDLADAVAELDASLAGRLDERVIQRPARQRDAARERALAQSQSLTGFLVGGLTSPSQAAMRDELRQQLQEALDGMDEIDREVLTLRHFEELSNNETAEVLGIHKAAASNRYARAMTRLYEILAGIPGFLDR